MAARRRIVLVVLGGVVLLLVGIVAVIAARSAPTRSSGDTAAQPTIAIGEAPPADGSAADTAGKEAQAAAPSSDQAAQQVSPVVPVVPVVPADRSVVRSAQLNVEVGDVGRAAADVRQAATAAGGFVSDERSATDDASLTVKVPAPRLDQAIERIAAVGKVTTRSQQADDVTEQVADLDGRLATQQASVARVRALLDRATSVGEVVEIESELTRREADLESLQRRRAAVAAQVELSTVSVELRGAGAAPAPSEDSGFLAGLAAGWEALLAAGRWTGTLLGAILPFVPVLLAVGGGALLLRRAWRRRHALAS